MNQKLKNITCSSNNSVAKIIIEASSGTHIIKVDKSIISEAIIFSNLEDIIKEQGLARPYTRYFHGFSVSYRYDGDDTNMVLEVSIECNTKTYIVALLKFKKGIKFSNISVGRVSIEDIKNDSIKQ